MSVVFICQDASDPDLPYLHISVSSFTELMALLREQPAAGRWPEHALPLVAQDIEQLLCAVDDTPAPPRSKARKPFRYTAADALRARAEKLLAVVQAGIQRQCPVSWG